MAINGEIYDVEKISLGQYDIWKILENLGGGGRYSKTIVCPDECVIFKLTAPLGNENFHKGLFFDFQGPDIKYTVGRERC